MNTWFQIFYRRHTIIMLVILTLALLAAPLLTLLPLSIQLIVLATSIVIFGLPHGALDLTLIRGSSSGAWHVLALSIFVYLLGLATVICAWLHVPILMLTSFLMLAVAHFGFGDTGEITGLQRALEIIVRGGSTIVIPLFFQTATTLELFTILVGPESTTAMHAASQAIMPSAGWIWSLCLIASISWRVSTRRPGWLLAILELILIAAVFAMLQPLIAFLLYFNLIHSVRHLADLGAARFPKSGHCAWRWLLSESLPLTVATLILATIAFYLFRHSINFNENITRVIFWGLSALTIPHMVLVACWHLRGERPPGDLFYQQKSEST